MPERATGTIVVDRRVSETYALWADFENFPRFMKHLRSVRRTGERMTHWVAEGPLGFRPEWDAEITRLEPPKRIAWRSPTGSRVKASGDVTLHALPGGNTQVTVTLRYAVPTGRVAARLARLVDVEGLLEENLRRFKAFAETDRVTTKLVR